MQTEKRTREVSFNVFLFLVMLAVGGFVASAGMLIVMLFGVGGNDFFIITMATIIGSIGYFCSLGVLHIKPSKESTGKPKKSKHGFEMPSKEEAYAMVKNAKVPQDVAVDIIARGYEAAPRSEMGAHLPTLANLTAPFRAIGQALHDAGGLDAMNGAFEKLNIKNPEAAKTVKILWDRVGDWKGF
jgi:hypothetical protein